MCFQKSNAPKSIYNSSFLSRKRTSRENGCFSAHATHGHASKRKCVNSFDTDCMLLKFTVQVNTAITHNHMRARMRARTHTHTHHTHTHTHAHTQVNTVLHSYIHTYLRNYKKLTIVTNLKLVKCMHIYLLRTTTVVTQFTYLELFCLPVNNFL